MSKRVIDLTQEEETKLPIELPKAKRVLNVQPADDTDDDAKVDRELQWLTTCTNLVEHSDDAVARAQDMLEAALRLRRMRVAAYDAQLQLCHKLLERRALRELAKH